MSNKLKVGYQGISGAYSEGALIELFSSHPTFKGKPYETVPFQNFKDLFDAVDKGTIDHALAPIENSYSGSLHNVYDLMLKYNLFITGEYIYHEKHCLLGLADSTIDDIKEVMSHPHVLEQCSSFLSQYESKISKRQADDTAGSASFVKKNNLKHVAAIAGQRAAEIHGLKVLVGGIEDDNKCTTRYFLYSKQPVVPERHTEPKTSIVVSLKNAPGHLFKALSCFALRDLNVSKIESRPSTRSGSMYTSSRPWEYIMYLDVEGSLGETSMKNAIKNLEEFATNVRVLGSYPRFSPPLKTSSLGPFGL